MTVDAKIYPFDATRNIRGNTPENFGQAAVNVCDTLHEAVLILKQELKEYTSSDAVALCEMILMENERLQAVGKEETDA
jgi:hypothetical protein